MAQVLDGRVVLYGVPHWFRGQQDIFEAGCFNGSLDSVFMGIDHEFAKPKLGDCDDGSLELFDDDVALHFRLKLGPGALEQLDGRSEASAAYFVQSFEVIKGIRHIKRAILIEVSAVHIGSLTQSHCIVRDAKSVGTLADDAKRGFANDAAFTKVMAALRRLK